MVTGETQITGQIKKAYTAALKVRSVGVVLNRLFHKAFFTAKKIRTKTAVGRYTVSVGHAAVELAREHYADFSQCRVMVIGAGEIGGVAARKIEQAKPKALYIANRTQAKACELACELNVHSLAWDELYDMLEKVDLIISSAVCNNYILCYDHLAKLTHPLLLIDIGLPRNLEPRIAEAPNCKLYNIDDLQQIVDRHTNLRRREAHVAESILDAATGAYETWLRNLALSPTIAALSGKLSTIITTELARADITFVSQAQADKLTRAIVNRVLYDPVKYLKHEGHRRDNNTYLDTLRKLFNLDADTGKGA